ERDAAEVREKENELTNRVQTAHEALTDATLRRNTAEKEHAAAEQAYATTLRAIADRREGLARLNGQVNSIKSRLEASEEEVERLARRRDEAIERAAEAERSYHGTESSLAGLGASESDLDAEYEEAAEAVARHEHT